MLPGNSTEPPATKARVGRRSRALLPGKTLGALGVALAAIFAVAWMSSQSLETRAAGVMSVNHTNEVREHLNLLILDLTDAEAGSRGFLLAGLESYLEPYDRALTSLSGEVATLRRLTADNPDQQLHLNRLEPMMAERLDVLAQGIALKRAGQAEAAVEIVRRGRGMLLMDRLRAVIEEMNAVEARLLDERMEAWQDSVTESTYVTFGGSAALLFALMSIAWFASRDFRTREAEAWLRRVQLALNTQVQGDLRVEAVAEKILGVLVESLDARVGAIYMTEPGGQLRQVARHALEQPEPSATLQLGEGLTGQAAKENQTVHLRDLPKDYMRVTSAVGRTKPCELVIAPASVDGTVHAVVELGFLHAVDATELEVLDRASETIAIAIRSAVDRSRLEALLEETQRQAEELQAQQEELRVSNEELEQQSRTLQVSQIQLESGQAELEQINAQLEEQTKSLEQQRDELARAGAELQRASVYKSEFLANMSHELRTPLNSSLILAKLLSDNREGNLNPEQIKFAQTIYSAGNDLLTLINDILDLSKIEAGKLDVRPESIAIARLVDDLANTFQPIAAQRQLDLAMSIEAGLRFVNQIWPHFDPEIWPHPVA